MISPKGYSKKERDAYKENKQRRNEKEGGKGKAKGKGECGSITAIYLVMAVCVPRA